MAAAAGVVAAAVLAVFLMRDGKGAAPAETESSSAASASQTEAEAKPLAEVGH